MLLEIPQHLVDQAVVVEEQVLLAQAELQVKETLVATDSHQMEVKVAVVDLVRLEALGLDSLVVLVALAHLQALQDPL